MEKKLLTRKEIEEPSKKDTPSPSPSPDIYTLKNIVKQATFTFPGNWAMKPEATTLNRSPEQNDDAIEHLFVGRKSAQHRVAGRSWKRRPRKSTRSRTEPASQRLLAFCTIRKMATTGVKSHLYPTVNGKSSRHLSENGENDSEAAIDLLVSKSQVRKPLFQCREKDAFRKHG
ncbi:hypothetical protein PoB_001325200 [Plakobranchus ocellatus]|uniref:Uncharacterized protein n=1 Tax=Plakobranchus ocellatus TaxID=259542 RepID=A0AAV3YUX9_9GAST|nr:hypothetical protein PoB_001325200 [Plakobranchus ocellatus]